MATDIVPGLLEKIQTDFRSRLTRNTRLKKLNSVIGSGQATFEQGHEYASIVGRLLSESLNEFITIDNLPDGKMYYNIANRILNTTMTEVYDIDRTVLAKIQQDLMTNAGLSFKPQIPVMNQDRVDGLVEILVRSDNFDMNKWVLGDTIENFSLSIVDDFVKVNSEFQSDSGMRPKITRKMNRETCDWCENLAGEYWLDEAPDEIYMRHKNCDCNVIYDPRTGRFQDVWSRRTFENKGQAERKQIAESFERDERKRIKRELARRARLNQ